MIKQPFKASAIGNTLIVLGLMLVGILAAVVSPMLNANVNKAKLQEATDTLDAIKYEVADYVSEVGAGTGNLNEAEILTILGVQVPLSTGTGGGRKWTYRIVDATGGGGTYNVRATGGAAGDIGSVLAGQWVEVRGTWNPANGVFTSWYWFSSAGVRASWLPK
jgi:type II secretory pathway pseudopilin PulG